MNITRRNTSGRVAILALTLALPLSGCADATGVGGPGNVALNFRVAGGAPAAVALPGGPSLVAGPPMTLVGTNGSLTLTEVRVIINEVELKPADGSCDSVSGEDDSDDCPEFEAPPRFLDLPLDGQPIDAVTAQVAEGSYKELDFEIEDLEDDETGAAEAAAIAAVRTEILAEFPDWPRKASTLISGTFAPAAGGSIDFRVFLDAEIEIEMELMPRLEVDAEGNASRSLTVEVRPDIWFMRPDGTVMPLHLYDYDLTGDLLEFEVEMEDGFTEIEIG